MELDIISCVQAIYVNILIYIIALCNLFISMLLKEMVKNNFKFMKKWQILGPNFLLGMFPWIHQFLEKMKFPRIFRV